MKTHPHLTSALWNAAEAESQFAEVLTKINNLQAQFPDEYNAQLVDILDEFYAAHSQLQATKYHLMICFRAAQQQGGSK